MNESNKKPQDQAVILLNPLQATVRSSLFFRLTLRLLLTIGVIAGIAAFIAGLMLRMCV